MDEVEEILGRNRPEDDMLISLKMLVLQRAKVIGHESLAKKFDLKMLRAMGFILMEYLKGKVKDLSLVSGENAEFMDCCNLLKFSVEEIMSNEEIKACIGHSKTSPAKR
nr:uncharacterized protein LOC111997162 isoform X2 [Quercus suber]